MRRALAVVPAVAAFGLIGAGLAHAQDDETDYTGWAGQIDLSVGVDCIEEGTETLTVTASNPDPVEIWYSLDGPGDFYKESQSLDGGASTTYEVPANPGDTYTIGNAGTHPDPGTVTLPSECVEETTTTTPETTTPETTTTSPTTSESPTTTPVVPETTTTAPETTEGGPFEYVNCHAVRVADADPIYPGDYGFGPHLDGDNDGEGCEVLDSGYRTGDVDSGVIPVGGTETGPGADQ